MFKRPMVKYIGRYKDLIPAGYKFFKNPSNHYKMYAFSLDTAHTLWIFPAGNEFEIDGRYLTVGWIMQFVIVHRKEIDNIRGYYLNKKTGEWRRTDTREQRLAQVDINNKIYETEDKELIEKHFKTWDQIYIPEKMFAEILRLYDVKLIEIVEKEFPED